MLQWLQVWWSTARGHLIGVIEYIKPWSRLRWLVVLGAPAVLAILLAGWQQWGMKQGPYQVLSATEQVKRDEVKEASSSSSLVVAPETVEVMVVDVRGAVVNPGVKELVVGDRVVKALEAAGGLSGLADEEYVYQVLNLAQIMEDGDKLYIPTRAQVIASQPSPLPLLTKIDTPVSLLTKSSQSPKSSAISPTTSDKAKDGEAGKVGHVNINTASENELDGLPGVGPATVAKIVEGRPYQSIDELCLVIRNSSTCSGLSGLVSF